MKPHQLIPVVFLLLTTTLSQAQNWQTADTTSLPVKRHENAMTGLGDKLYLLGGRGIKPVNVYDTKTNAWTAKGQTPLEMHHFQAVMYRGELYVLGAFTGPYPHEKPIPTLYIYNPDQDAWRTGAALPENRHRGAAGVAVYNDKIYLVCGIQDGHWDGNVAWMDEFDPKTASWKTLADAPHARDHLHAAVLDNKLYIAGGRLSSAKTGRVLNQTVGAVDVYDFKRNAWTTLDSTLNIPTQRAGGSSVVFDNKLLVIGGESGQQVPAHSEVEAYNPKTKRWEKLPNLKVGRHGTGAVMLRNKLYTAAGSGNRGGGPELNSMEVLK